MAELLGDTQANLAHEKEALTAHVGTLQASLAMREEQLARCASEAASRTLAELLRERSTRRSRRARRAPPPRR